MISRTDALRAFGQEEFDVAVVGGGITGAGVALDAASRGYSVALIERSDYAAGTSSKSSKMVHGGLRYLQNFDLGLVREALVERQVLVELAPHLVRPVPFMVPAFEGGRVDRKVGLGLNMYSVLQRTRGFGGRDTVDVARGRGGRYQAAPSPSEWSPERHRTVGPEQVLELAPALEPRDPTSAYLFYDCQTDDVRLVFTVLGEAERFGAVLCNYVEAAGLVERDGRLRGLACVDRISGDSFELRAKNVVNATGVWADQLRPAELHGEAEVPVIRPSRGTHITLRYEDVPLKGALVVPAGGDRTIFALPWMGRTLVGTTDRDYTGSLDTIAVDGDDVEYLLDAVNAYFAVGLTQDDITGAYAGVRPLISTGDPKKSVDISRKAELYETSSGMLTITGGKLTTYRRMAKLTVDRLVERESRSARCHTEMVPLGDPIEAASLVSVGAAQKVADHLAGRYGRAALNVLAHVGSDAKLGDPIVDGCPDILAEVVTAARSEQAVTVADVMLRRTRLGILAARPLTASIDGRREQSSHPAWRVASAMGQELGWDRKAVKNAVGEWFDTAAREGIAP